MANKETFEFLVKVTVPRGTTKVKARSILKKLIMVGESEASDSRVMASENNYSEEIDLIEACTIRVKDIEE